MDTLKRVLTFREVAVCSGSSRAVKTLVASKANVNNYVSEPEWQFGTRLRTRSTRTLSLANATTLLRERSTPLPKTVGKTSDWRCASGRMRCPT